MCFSAAASFTAATVLTVIGVASVAKTRSKKEIAFALIPLFFAVQQAVEGVVWLSVKSGNMQLLSIASSIFVFFAYAFWPMYVPVSVVLLEKKSWRRKILWVLEFCGVLLGSYFIYFIANTHISATIVNKCIAYTTPQQGIIPIILIYLATTCFSLLISSDTALKSFGVAASLFLLIAYAFYDFAFVSVWCFFAAVLSVIIYYHFRRRSLGVF